MIKITHYILIIFCTSCITQCVGTKKAETSPIQHHHQKTDESKGLDSIYFKPSHEIKLTKNKAKEKVIKNEISIENLSFLSTDNSKKPFIVLLFLGTDCPISQKYMNTVRNLSSKYKDSVAFFGLFTDSYSMNEILIFKKTYGIDFEMIKDNRNEFAKSLNATHTPEVFLIDLKGNIKYQGAIDNWFYELGKNRRTVTAHYLENAIKEVMLGKKITLNYTSPIGCFIELK